MPPSTSDDGLSARRRTRRAYTQQDDNSRQNAFLVAMFLTILGAIYVRRNYMERTDEPGSNRLVFRTAEAIAAREERRRQARENFNLGLAFGLNDTRAGSAGGRTKRKRAVVRQPRWAGLWESSLATAFTSCRKLQAAPAMVHWQQPCAPKPWAHFFRSGPLDCTFLGTDYGGFYLPNRMCFLNEFEPSRPPVAYGFGIGSDVSYDLALASAYPSLKVRPP